MNEPDYDMDPEGIYMHINIFLAYAPVLVLRYSNPVTRRVNSTRCG